MTTTYEIILAELRRVVLALGGDPQAVQLRWTGDKPVRKPEGSNV
jgi:hypothetical protein